MEEPEEKTADYDQPVAYDSNGQPLYAHPPKQPQPVVHVARSAEPDVPVISDEMKSRHESSVKRFPMLNLSETEYVIMMVKRHPVALVGPFGIGALLIGLVWAFQINYDLFAIWFGLSGASAEPAFVSIPVFAFTVLVALGMAISYYVYDHNRFYLTNESVIQNIQYTLFAKREQAISLGSIEDASFTQVGVLQYILNYGTIRLSTVGEEGTYQLTYVGNPKLELATLNNAVESFKNGRRVG